MNSGQANSDGILYSPNKSGKTYISLNYHRSKTKKDKTLWMNNISRIQEYELFCTSDDNIWATNNGPTADYWGILNKGDTELGTEGEWLCKFERPINDPDPWHGYPVGENTKGITPGKYLVEFWFQTGVIDKAVQKRIYRSYR